MNGSTHLRTSCTKHNYNFFTAKGSGLCAHVQSADIKLCFFLSRALGTRLHFTLMLHSSIATIQIWVIVQV